MKKKGGRPKSLRPKIVVRISLSLDPDLDAHIAEYLLRAPNRAQAALALLRGAKLMGLEDEEKPCLDDMGIDL